MGKPIAKLIFSTIWLIFGLGLTFYTWSWFTTLAGEQGDDVFLAIYWVGYILIVGICAIISPLWIIATTMMNKDEE